MLNVFKTSPVICFREVFPQLPVIAIIVPWKLSLTNFDRSVKHSKVLDTFICFFRLRLFWYLFTIAKDAPLLIEFFKKKLPSFFFPLIAKNISFFFNVLELIDAEWTVEFLEIFLPKYSFKIFTLIFFESFLFFLNIDFLIISLSEKKFFLLP